MTDTSYVSSPELTLGDYLQVLSRRRWVIVGVFLATVAAAVAATLVQTPSYRATASVLVRTAETTNLFPLGGATDVTRSVAGEQAFLNSNTFQQQAMAASPQPSSVRTISDEGNLDASQRSIIGFEATASSAEVAAEAANAWAATYIQARFDAELAEQSASIAAIQGSIDRLREQRAELLRPMDDLDAAIDRSSDAVEIARLNNERLLLVELLGTELGAIDTQLDRLNTNMAELTVTRDLLSAPELSARINDPATVPGGPLSPNLLRNLALGVVSGLILSLGAALVMESLDGRLRSVDEVSAVTGLPHMASIPRIKKRGVPLGVSEAQQRIVSALTLADSAGTPTQVIMFTSALAGEGKTSTATSVAQLLAKGHNRTLLIDGDLHRPAASQRLNVANRIGLADYLQGARAIDEIIFESPDTSYLDIIPSGRAEPGEMLDLIRKPQLEVLIDKVRGAYDHVIIDSPPVLAVVDPVELAVHADCSVMVVRSGRLSASELAEAQRVLASSRVPIVGTVLVAPSAEVKNVYAHGY